MKVAVIGGGAVGATAAYDLADRGADVTLFERGDIAGASTGRAAGICYDAFAEDVDARVADRAVERFREFSGQGEFEFEETPYVWFAREGDERRERAIREHVPRMRDNGRDVELVDPDDLAAEWPALRTDDVAVAAVARDAGRVRPATYAELLAEKAETAGARIETGVEASVATDPAGVVVDGERRAFDAVLVAAGAHTKRLLADAGVPVALKPYRVQALTTVDGPDVPLTYDATGGFYVRPYGDGLLAGDGTEEVESDPDDWKRDADDWFVADVRDGLAHRIGHDADVTDAWAGLCTATPDHDPLLGELRDGLYVAAGWQGHGFMRSPALGEAAAEAVLDGDGIPAFDPTRFSGDEEFEIVEGMTVEE
ncbi:FAD-binding oxidoreductase [Halostella sp. JP-L12]|uniref:NAD(P)/FAD-dependent oxidoreductase n=1 Tax=Halostella TaxID=1843185 RepID=UPI000EF7D3F0|nr:MULTISPECIES: FAD-binding oxidoreductase [Halostella]NHN47464.1 FAD-binding oxidoreductase [Halostella sp. JP-L12]